MKEKKEKRKKKIEAKKKSKDKKQKEERKDEKIFSFFFSFSFSFFFLFFLFFSFVSATSEQAGIIFLEDGNVVVDFVLLVLGDTFGNPNDVPDFLLLQLDKRVEDGVIELLLER